jgi:hypothetical protein
MTGAGTGHTMHLTQGTTDADCYKPWDGTKPGIGGDVTSCAPGVTASATACGVWDGAKFGGVQILEKGVLGLVTYGGKTTPTGVYNFCWATTSAITVTHKTAKTVTVVTKFEFFPTQLRTTNASGRKFAIYVKGGGGGKFAIDDGTTAASGNAALITSSSDTTYTKVEYTADGTNYWSATDGTALDKLNGFLGAATDSSSWTLGAPASSQTSGNLEAVGSITMHDASSTPVAVTGAIYDGAKYTFRSVKTNGFADGDQVWLDTVTTCAGTATITGKSTISYDATNDRWQGTEVTVSLAATRKAAATFLCYTSATGLYPTTQPTSLLSNRWFVQKIDVAKKVTYESTGGRDGTAGVGFYDTALGGKKVFIYDITEDAATLNGQYTTNDELGGFISGSGTTAAQRTARSGSDCRRCCHQWCHGAHLGRCCH